MITSVFKDAINFQLILTRMQYSPRFVWIAIIANGVAMENVTDGVNTSVRLEKYGVLDINKIWSD
jgi:hypothetical protein